MSPETIPASKNRGCVRLLITFVIAFDVAAFFQWADGSFQSEFGGHADEAANYLGAFAHTRDGATADGETPNQSGQDVGKGRRAFSAVLGGWMSVFGTSRIAALLFMALLAAATATLIFAAVQNEAGPWPAAGAAILWLFAPAVRGAYGALLPELFGALLLTASALLWARMMKMRGPACAPACRWLGRAAMVFGGAILAIALATKLGLRAGDARAARSFLGECTAVMGVAAAAFALGAALLGKRADATGPAMIALVAGALFARWMKPGPLDSHLLVVATPALAVLAALGAIALAERLSAQSATAAGFSRRRALWLFLLLLLSVPAYLLHHSQKEWQGFGSAADSLIGESRGEARVLVVSDPRGEVMLLSEIAMRGSARQITIERGSETLTDPAGSAPHGRPMERFLEDEQLLAHLTSGRIRYIVFDSAVPQDVRAGYHDQVQRVLEGNVRNFWPVCDCPIIRDGEPMGHPLRIFRVMNSEGVQLQ